MAIATFADLLAFVTEEHELDSQTVAQLPNLIRMAEAEMGRLLNVPPRDVVAIASTTAGAQTVTLPSDFIELRAIWIDDEDELRQVELTRLQADYTRDQSAGQPQVYALVNDSIYLGPIPDQAYQITMAYQGTIPALSTANTSNWLLTAHPDAYRWALGFQIKAWLRDPQAASACYNVLQGVCAQINRQGTKSRNGGPLVAKARVVA